jgi:hypothetical protein
MEEKPEIKKKLWRRNRQIYCTREFEGTAKFHILKCPYHVGDIGENFNVM